MTETGHSQAAKRVSRKKTGAQMLSHLLPEMIEPVLRQRGFANATILTEWAEIAGPLLAASTTPLELKWPPRSADQGAGAPARSARLDRSRKATLIVASTSAGALDLQMMSAALIQQINRRLGFDCVGAIQIRQGALARQVKRSPPRQEDPALIRQVSEALDDIRDAGLREALARLGAGIIGKSKGV